MNYGEVKPLKVIYIKASDRRPLEDLERGAFFEYEGDVYLKCFGPLHPETPAPVKCWNFTKGWFFNCPDDKAIVKELDAELVVIDRFARREVE